MLIECPLCGSIFRVRFTGHRICPRCLGKKKRQSTIKKEQAAMDAERILPSGFPKPLTR